MHGSMNIKFINDSIRLFISDICNRFLRQKNALKFKNILFFFTINSKEQSSSWESNRFSARQGIPLHLWKPKVYFRIYKRPPPVVNYIHTTGHYHQTYHDPVKLSPLPVPVATRSKGPWPAEIVGSNPAGGAWIYLCCEFCLLSGRGLYDELITRPEESYRLWCVVVFGLETSWMRRQWPTGRCWRQKKKSVVFIFN